MTNLVVTQNDLSITVTPNTTELNVYAGGYACAQGNTTEFQYNNGGALAGANGLTYNSGTQTTTAANLSVTNDANLGAVGNVTITGGNINQFLKTDGAGVLSFSDIANANYANFAGTVLTNAQPNITSVGNLSNLTVTGNATANFFIGNGSQLTGIGDGTSISNGTSNVRVNSANGNVSIGVNGNANILVATANGIVVTRANLGNASNLTITGGINGYFLQTDGTGNLTWAAGGNVSGNGVPGGANTQIQFNDGGSFGGKAGFTFNRTTDALNAPGSITAVGNVQGQFIKGDGGLLTNVAGAGGSFIANGNSNVSIATANGNITVSANNTSNVVVISSNNVTITAEANIVGNVTTNNISAGNVYANTGTIRGVNLVGNTCGINGNLISGNANLGNAARANFFIGNGSLLTGIDSTAIQNGNANVRTFANANVTISAAGNANIVVVTGTGVNIAGTLNTTGVITGNGSGLSQIAGGNVTGTVAMASFAGTAGTVTANSQPNITSLGSLTGLTITANSNIAMSGTGSQLSGANLVSATYLTGTLTTASQPNITSVGTLTSLVVSGNITAGNFIGSISTLANGNSNVRISSNGNITFSLGGTSNAWIMEPGKFSYPANVGSGGEISVAQITLNNISGIPATPFLSLQGSNGTIAGANLVSSTYIRAWGQSRASLGNPGNANPGVRSFIIDANTNVFNSIVGGFGSNSVPVFWDGTNWRVG